MVASDSSYELDPVSFSRLSSRGIILGLSATQVVAMTFAVVTFVSSLYLAGGRALIWSSPLWATAVALTWVPVGGRKTVEWLPVALHWGWRTLTNQTVYRRRISKPRPTGTLALPGDAASLREYEDPETGIVMVHDPHAQQLIAIAELSHRGFLLLDPSDQQRRISGWSRVLATACRSNRIARIQVLERTLPDSGTGLNQWWADHGNDDGSWISSTYKELINMAGPAAERHTTTISVALDLKAAARAVRAAGGGIRGAAQMLRQEITSLTGALESADLKAVRWKTPADLSVALRTAYDPQAAAAIEQSGRSGRLATAGPVAIEETWDALRSDSAHHAVLWVSEWPRTSVYPGFLAPLILTGGVQRSISIVIDPVNAVTATRQIRKKKTEYLSDATQRARIGQIEDAQQTAEYQDVLQQEADLTAGHGLLRYTALIAVTAPTRDLLDSAVAQIEQAAIQSACETRRLVGQQAQAFTAAALPLCRGI